MPPTNNQTPSAYPQYMQPKHHKSWLLPFLVVLLLLLGALGVGGWAYASMLDYKNHSDQKSATAVKAAETALTKKLDADFVEREKSPLKTYTGPNTFGSISITYPKTWSAYVAVNERSAIPIDGYMHPNVVPGLQTNAAYALHFQVTSTSYDQELKKYDNAARTGAVTVASLAAPKVSNVNGARIDGEIETGKKGTAVLFPLRDKTLKITTESPDYANDFNNTILPNLTFVP